MRKEFRVSLKDMNISEEGKGQIVFATLGVLDKDNDITDKGAFGNQLAHLLPMHVWKDADTPFIGVASIKEVGNQAIADIELNMDLQRAKDWRSSMKFALDHGKNIEWSYGFDVADSEVRTVDGKKVRALKSLIVHEVSPVVIGAGEGTGIVSMKAYAQLRGTFEAAQDAIQDAAHALLVGRGDGWCSLQGTYADTVVVSCYRDYDAEQEIYQFDWTMNDDGTVALSNQREVTLDVVVREKSLRFAEDFARVLGTVSGFTARSKALAALRTKEGRTLSQATRTRLTALLPRLTDTVTDLSALLSETEPALEDAAKAINLDSLYAEFLHTQSQVSGHISR